MNADLYRSVDYFLVEELYSEENKIAAEAVRDWVNRRIIPNIESNYEKAVFPLEYVKEMGELGIFGPFIPPEYGGAGMDYISYGLMMQELERGDSGVRSMASVQSSLVMYPIYSYGSEEQKKKYLPALAKGDIIACFGLTEPNHGSDPGSMLSKITRKGKQYILNGAKMWITNASIADLAVVWAKDEKGMIRGILLEKGRKGFSSKETKGKWSLRASITGELIFDDVLISEDDFLPDAVGLKAPLTCLNSARYGIAWGVVGAAMDCYNAALHYAMERKQFGKPIAAFQLQQKKLSEAITEITKAQLMLWRLGKLRNENKATAAQISMTKRNNVAMALNICREMRQILGAMGITNDFPMMRHCMNLESVITYEGTHDIHHLITGADITGIQAFD
ncbi:MAG: acyl-CoA dehydrogenase [Marinilabiliales bacterium]|nr:MAG: acyl-CoA dehydrogenase [Marinilabiliales bacterium]